MDVRLIAATHKDLKKLTHSNLFRADLYYRINVIKIDLPRLTDRGNDLLEIAEKLLDDAAIKYNKPGLHLSPNTISSLKNYSWPGNIRELQNVIERSAIMTETQSIGNELLELDIETEKKNIKNTSKDNNDTELFYMQNISTNKNHKEPLTNNNEELSLEDYFQRFVLDNQEHMNETELAKKLGISRKCLWERRQRFAIPRNKSNKSN